MPITLKKYTLQDKTGNVIVDTDFAFPLVVPKEAWKVVLTDLTNPKAVIPSSFSSSLVITGDSSEITVSSDHEAKTLAISPTGTDISTWLNTELKGSVLDPNTFVLSAPKDDEIESKLTILLGKVGSEIEEAVKTVDEFSTIGPEAAQLQKLDKEIKELEERLNAQKRQDELKITEQELEAKLDVLQEQLAGVDEMLVKLDKIKEQIQKYESLLGPSYMQKEETLRKEAISKREQLLLELTKHTSGGVKTAAVVTDEVKDEKPRSPWPLLIGWSLALLLPVLLYFVLGDWKISLVLEILAVGGSIAYLYFSDKKRPYDLDAVVDKLKKKEELEDKSEKISKEITGSILGGIEKFLVDTAWLDALKAEAAGLEASIQKQTGEGEETGTKGDRVEVEKQLSNVKSELGSLVVKEIDTKDYLGFLRELDTKKAQRMDLEMKFQQQGEKYSKYLDIVEKQLKYSWPEGLNKYKGLKYAGGKLVYQGESGLISAEMIKEEKLSLYIWLFILSWQADPIWPLISAGLSTSLPAKLYASVEDQLQSASEAGQVIVINVA